LKTHQITDQIVSANSQTCNYTYDDLSRLAGRDASSQSVNCGANWAQAFTLDPFGNLSKSGSSSFVAGYVLANGSTNNRIQSITGAPVPTYDANGDLLTITDSVSHSNVWDGYGKPVSIDSVGLTYDALGRVAEQNRSGVFTQIVYSPTGDKFTLMSGTSLSKAFLPLPGGGTAVFSASGLQYYRHPDSLGSSRLATTPSRTKYFDGDYAPYGEDYDKSGTTDLSFTGQNQDTVAGLYDFMYREYSPIAGRWVSPDPAGNKAVNPANPQSWNRYAYVLNSPLNAVDPDGLWCVWDNGSGHDDDPQDGGYTQEGCAAAGGHWDPTDTVLNMWESNGIVTFMNVVGHGIQDMSSLRMTLGELDQSWNALTSAMSAPIGQSNCHYHDAIAAGVEMKAKLGAEFEFADFDVGFSFVKTFGEDGVTSEGSIGFKGLIGLQRKYDTPLGGPDDSLTILGFNKDISTPFFSKSGWKFQPSKTFKFGIQFLAGVEFGWNSDKFNAVPCSPDSN